jgi:hypothetical protein
MRFLYEAQKTIKAGFYVDYYFKKIFIFLFKKILQNNFFILLDKFIAEEFFYSIKNFFLNIKVIIDLLKKAKGLTLLKILFFIFLQILIIVIL